MGLAEAAEVGRVIAGPAVLLATIVKDMIMGYTPEPTVYNLNFDESSSYPGLTVKIRGCTVREWNLMMEMAISREPEEVLKNNRASMDLFLSHLVEWNLDLPGKEGSLTPTTWDGIQEHDNKLITDLYIAWQRAMTAVPDELGKESKNGSISEEALLGLGASSASPPSFPMQS
jgi:hypothetical protein